MLHRVIRRFLNDKIVRVILFFNLKNLSNHLFVFSNSNYFAFDCKSEKNFDSEKFTENGTLYVYIYILYVKKVPRQKWHLNCNEAVETLRIKLVQ